MRHKVLAIAAPAPVSVPVPAVVVTLRAYIKSPSHRDPCQTSSIHSLHWIACRVISKRTRTIFRCNIYRPTAIRVSPMCPSRVPRPIASLWAARITMPDRRTLSSIRSTNPQIILVPIIITRLATGIPMPMILLAIRLDRCAATIAGNCHAPPRYHCPRCPYIVARLWARLNWRPHWTRYRHHRHLHRVRIYSSHVLAKHHIRISRQR